MPTMTGRSSRVKQILTFDGELNHAFAPQSVTLLLADDLDVARGDMMVRDLDSAHVANDYNADICWLRWQVQ